MIYHRAMRQLLERGQDPTLALWARLVMADTTCLDENAGIEHLADFTRIDPCDAPGYEDLPMDCRFVIDPLGIDLEFADLEFSHVYGGSRGYLGILIYVRVDGTDVHDWPYGFVEFYSDIWHPDMREIAVRSRGRR